MKLRDRQFKNKWDQRRGDPMVTVIMVGEKLVVPNCPFCRLDHVHDSGLATDRRRDRGYHTPPCCTPEESRSYLLLWTGLMASQLPTKRC